MKGSARRAASTAREDFTFDVDSSLLSELGEKLVTTVHAALAELVKNAYDGDAQTVQVQILPEGSIGAPRVIIQDDGVGMTPDDVRRFWMKIGTTNKVERPNSANYGRSKTGSKGVGRFACRRLGLHLSLRTTAIRKGPRSGVPTYQTTQVDFNWNDFVAGKGVETVPCKGWITSSKAGGTGTRLEISGGKTNEWQTRGFTYLQRQLAALASNRGARREGFHPDPGFNVLLEAPGLTENAIDLRDTIMDATWGTLTATVESDGRATLALSAKGLGGTKKHTSQARFSKIAGASLRVGILPKSKDDARRPAILARYVLSEVMDAWGGIQVRFNGFRMFPYGDRGDDWLGIDADRGRRLGKPDSELVSIAKGLDRVNPTRAMLNMLSGRNYLGQVNVTSEIKGLQPRIDRQGFVDNEAFEQLRRFVRFAVDWANLHREFYIRLTDHDAAETARHAFRPVLDLEGPKETFVPKALDYLRKEIKRIVAPLPGAERINTEHNLIRAMEVIKTADAERFQQLQHLRLVASASTLTLVFAQEVRTVIGTLDAAAVRLEELAQKNPAHRAEMTTLGRQLRESKGHFDALASMAGLVGAVRSSDIVATVQLGPAIHRALQCFHLIIHHYAIMIDDAAVQAGLTVGPMMEGELYTIFLHVFSNAIKSVIAAGDPLRGIRIAAHRKEERTVIEISDTGLGLDPQFFEKVFTPFVSDPDGTLYDRLEEHASPQDASLFATGSGLGLTIARDIARSRGGDIRFIVPQPPWKATIKVELL